MRDKTKKVKKEKKRFITKFVLKTRIFEVITRVQLENEAGEKKGFFFFFFLGYGEKMDNTFIVAIQSFFFLFALMQFITLCPIVWKVHTLLID